MPLIQELANAPVSSTPGFAYVPDTGFDPSKEAIIPTGPRKRQSGRAVINYGGGENLSRQEQQKISRHLAELERDNRADLHIALPGKPSNVALRGLRGKMTPAVKKIMQSQKTIANHLADEEAAIANTGSAIPPPPTATRQVPGRKDSKAALPPPAPQANLNLSISQAREQQDASPARLGGPDLPSQAEIEALISAAPLPYAESRIGPTTSTAPPRKFCAICGYWGRVRCKGCGERVCGLECLTGHRETCQRY